MKPPELKDDAFLTLAKLENNCSIAAGSLAGVFHGKQGSGIEPSDAEAAAPNEFVAAVAEGEDERKAPL